MREDAPRAKVKSPRLERQSLTRVLTDQGMYDHASAFLNERLYQGLTGHQLVQLRPGKDGRPSSRRVVYELRFHEFGTSEQAVIGRIDERQFIAHLRANYDNCIAQLKSEQETCDWELVAAFVEPFNLRRSFAVPALDGQDAFSHSTMLSSRKEGGVTVGQGVRQTVRHIEAPDYRCQVKMVFADVARAELSDPNLKHGDRPGPMSRYADSRELRHLTSGQREGRRTCEQLVRLFWGIPEPEADLFRGVEPPPSRDEFDDLIADEEAPAGKGEDEEDEELDIEDPRVQRALAKLLAKKEEPSKKKRETPPPRAKAAPVSPGKEETSSPARKTKRASKARTVAAPALQTETREKAPVVEVPQVDREEQEDTAAIHQQWREGVPPREIASALGIEYGQVTKAIARFRALEQQEA